MVLSSTPWEQLCPLEIVKRKKSHHVQVAPHEALDREREEEQHRDSEIADYMLIAQWACPCRRFILHTCPTREHSSLNGHFTKENHV